MGEGRDGVPHPPQGLRQGPGRGVWGVMGCPPPRPEAGAVVRGPQRSGGGEGALWGCLPAGGGVKARVWVGNGVGGGALYRGPPKKRVGSVCPPPTGLWGVEEGHLGVLPPQGLMQESGRVFRAVGGGAWGVLMVMHGWGEGHYGGAPQHGLGGYKAMGGGC